VQGFITEPPAGRKVFPPRRAAPWDPKPSVTVGLTPRPPSTTIIPPPRAESVRPARLVLGVIAAGDAILPAESFPQQR